jgi:hypothetical protein
MAPPSLIQEPIRKLPLWQDGYARGRDVGLAIALAALTAERGRQETMAAHRVKRERGRYVYAEGVLLYVSKAIASRFQSIGT